MQTTASFHDLKGASVFITGGGNGIGAALTEGFLEQGAQVAFVGRKDATGFAEAMADKYGIKPLYIPCDITDIPALHAAMDRAAAEHGPITTLVNTAAFQLNSDIAKWLRAKITAIGKCEPSGKRSCVNCIQF